MRGWQWRGRYSPVHQLVKMSFLTSCLYVPFILTYECELLMNSRRTFVKNDLPPLTNPIDRAIIPHRNRGAVWLRGSARFDPPPDVDNATVGSFRCKTLYFCKKAPTRSLLFFYPTGEFREKKLRLRTFCAPEGSASFSFERSARGQPEWSRARMEEERPASEAAAAMGSRVPA